MCTRAHVQRWSEEKNSHFRRLFSSQWTQTAQRENEPHLGGPFHCMTVLLVVNGVVSGADRLPKHTYGARSVMIMSH